MKKILIVLLAILALGGISLWFISTNSPKEQPRNEMVMYGYQSYDEYLKNRSDYTKQLDEELVNSVMNSGKVKDKADAAQQACDTGSSYNNKGDKVTAIKRYNQAWLLDHNHPCVYANYGYYYAFTEGNIEKSFEMYEKALSLSDKKESWWILTDYAEALDYCYAADNKRSDCLDKALINLTESLAIQDAPKTHRTLTFVYYHKEEYEKSWEQVHLAIDGGISKPVLDSFIDELKKEMSDPKGEL